MPTNSLTEEYTNTTIQYSYDEKNQTHSYANNWDFDGDGIFDSLYFVGNGGAHLFYTLHLKLSSEQKTRTFDYLLTDMPYIKPPTDLKKPKDEWPTIVIHDFNEDGKADVFFNLTQTPNDIPNALKKMHLTKPYVLLYYNSKTQNMLMQEYLP